MAQCSHGVDATDNVTRSDRRFGLDEISDCFGVAEEFESLFEAVEVVWAYEDRGRPSVAGDHDALVFAIHAVDEF